MNLEWNRGDREMQTMKGVTISPSGNFCPYPIGFGFARCFSGDADRVSFPLPYLADGRENPAYAAHTYLLPEELNFTYTRPQEGQS